MAVYENSRHTFCRAYVNDEGCTFLDDRAPYRYRALADNTLHVVLEGETIWSIAGWHFRPHPRAAGLWWAIADFQPYPIHDPTITLVGGSVLVLPSLRTVLRIALSEERRGESRA